MRSLHASLYDIEVTDASRSSTVDSIVDLARKWIEAKYAREARRWGTATLDFSNQGEETAPLAGHTLLNNSYETPSGRLNTIRWSHPDDQDPNFSWVVQLSAAAMDARAQFHCVVGIESRLPHLRPMRHAVGRPRVASEVVAAFDVRIGGWPVPTVPRTLMRDEVGDFVEDVLCNPERTLPVVVLSPDAWSGRLSLDPRSLHSKLAGSAEVAVLGDKFAAFAWTDEVGKLLSCFDGAVRVYWPGFTLDDQPRQHPLHLATTIRKIEGRSGRWVETLRDRLHAASVHAFAQSEVALAVRKAVAEEDGRRAREALERHRNDDEHTEILKEWENALQRAEAAEEERDRLRAENEQLKYAANWVATAADDRMDNDSGTEARRDFDTVADAVRAAQQEFKGVLVFLDTALDSAEKSPFKRPEQVFDMLQAMAEVTTEWREAEGSLGKPWEHAVGTHGYEFKVAIGETTRNQWGSQYTFQYEGEPLLFEQHITLGAKSPEKCLSAHFHRDEERLVLVVGHCGRHLRNTKT